MNKIVDIQMLHDFSMLIKFKDGVSVVVDFRPLIGTGISTALLDQEYFRKVSIDSGGGLEWPNGMDFCPNFLRAHSSAHMTSLGEA